MSVRAAEGPDPAAGSGGEPESLPAGRASLAARGRDALASGVLLRYGSARPASFAVFRVLAAHPPLSSRPACVAAAVSPEAAPTPLVSLSLYGLLTLANSVRDGACRGLAGPHIFLV